MPTGIEGTADLCTTKGAVVEQSAVVAGKGHTLRHTLVDDGAAHFGQTIDVGLTGAVVAALDGVAEEALDAVAVVLIVLGSIDATLGCNGVGTARRILYAENIHVEAQCSQRGGSRGTGKACSYHDDINLALVGGIDQFLAGFVVGPFF